MVGGALGPVKKGTIFADVPPWRGFSTLTERGKGCNNISFPFLGWYLFSQTPVSENTDPSGYKSGKALAAEKEMGFETLNLPRYSPDLNPWDFFLWNDIEARMTKSAPKNIVTGRRVWIVSRSAPARWR